MRLTLRRVAGLAASAGVLLSAPASARAQSLSIERDPYVNIIATASNSTLDQKSNSRTSKPGYYASGQAAIGDGSSAEAIVDVEAFGVKATAVGGERRSYAEAQAWTEFELWFFNASFGVTQQTVDSFFHGFLARGTGYGYAAMEISVTGLSYSNGWGRRETYTVPNLDGLNTMNVQQHFSGALDLEPGLNRFRVYLGLAAEAGGLSSANFGNTVNFYVPPTEGVTMIAPGSAGSRQYMPAWAVQTTAPEPATVALLGGGLVALGGVARRRAGARRAA